MTRGRAGRAAKRPNPAFQLQPASEVQTLAGRGLKFARATKLDRRPGHHPTTKADFKPGRLPATSWPAFVPTRGREKTGSV